MLRIFEETGGCLSLVPPPAAPQGLAPGPMRWFDLLSPTPEEDRFVEQVLGITLPTREEMEETELSARLYTEDGAEFLTVVAMAHASDGMPLKSHVTFVLKDNQLVTLRYEDIRAVGIIEGRYVRPETIPAPSAEVLMLNLLETGINRLADLLEQVSEDLDKISDHVFRVRGGTPEARGRRLEGLIERIGRNGRSLGIVRESLGSIGRLMAFHQARMDRTKKADPEVAALSKIIQRDAVALADNAGFLANKISFLLDAVLGLINLQQSGIIKIFSVAAVVFLPPTLIASIYGMNFVHMPELEWLAGYPMALSLMVLSAIGPFFFFKRKGWL